MGFLEGLGLFLAEEVADRLGSVVAHELGIVRVDDDLVNAGDDVGVDAMGLQVLLHRVHDHVADLALGHRADDVERLRGDLLLTGDLLHVKVARLRAVAVRDDETVAILELAHDLGEGLRGGFAVLELLLRRASLVSLLDGVPAKSYDYSHLVPPTGFRTVQTPGLRSSTITPFCRW
jgi:hypothetical protein